MWVLIVVIIMTLHLGLFISSYNSNSGSVLFGTVEKLSQGWIGQDIISQTIDMTVNKAMREFPIWVRGCHLLSFGGWHLKYMVDGVNMGNFTVAVDSAWGIGWLLVGFLFIGAITRKSINALYSAGPFIIYSIIAIILLHLGPDPGGTSSTPSNETWVIAKPFKEEVIYVWWPNLVNAFWSSLILGTIAFGTLRLAIKLKWLDGVDEYSHNPLRLQVETASADIGRGISRTREILDKASTHPVVVSAIGKAKEAGNKLGNEWSNIGNDIPQELGSDAHHCPYCGWPVFDNQGCCKSCNNQVREIPKLTEGHICDNCGTDILPGDSIQFCYACGKLIEKESWIDLSDDKLDNASLSYSGFPGMEDDD